MATKPNTYIGQSITRVEDERLLTGRGRFVGDIARDGLLHAAILRSSMAHGRIRNIDVSAAMRLPGVRAIFTAADIDGAIPTIPVRLAPIKGIERFVQPVIAKDKVRFVGEAIAVVVADSRALAEDAIELVEIDIEELAPVADRIHLGREFPPPFRGQRHECRRPLCRIGRRCSHGVRQCGLRAA